MAKPTNKKAFTLVEVVLASGMLLFMLATVFSLYFVVDHAYSMDSAKKQLYDDANIVLSKIIEGKTEPTGFFSLSEATSYNVVSVSELHFNGTDGVERWFRLNNTATALIYHHPTAAGTVDETIYTAPAGAAIILRFSMPAGSQFTGVVVGIDVAITRVIEGRTIAGSISTYVNIRNHAV